MRQQFSGNKAELLDHPKFAVNLLEILRALVLLPRGGGLAVGSGAIPSARKLTPREPNRVSVRC